MIKSYIVIALRNIAKYKGYSLINIAGFAIGMACCILIIIYIQDELSYDKYHENADRIYRTAFETESSGRTVQYPSVGGGVAPALLNDFPDIISAVRFIKIDPAWLKVRENRFEENRFYLADSTVFNIFSFEFFDGDPETALMQPNMVVITESIAEKYFGRRDAVGEIITVDTFNGIDLQVTGVIKDVPRNSHFQFDFIASLSSLRSQANPALFTLFAANICYTYFLIPENYSISTIEQQLPSFLEKHVNEEQREWLKSIFFQPLTDIHLHSNLLNEIEQNSNINYIYIFSTIAVLTLLIACINFMNLATARSANRAQEVGIRKVNGALRTHLIYQFMGESLLFTLTAFILAVIITLLTLPFFSSITGKELSFNVVDNAELIALLAGFAVVVGLFAGTYPAIFLSSFKPVIVLKSKLTGGTKSALLRKIFVIAQFTLSISFIAGSIVINNQLDFIQNTDMGFEKENVIVIPLNIPAQNSASFINTARLLKTEYDNNPDIVSASLTMSVPGQLRPLSLVQNADAPPEERHEFVTVDIDYDFFETLNMELADGRTFSPKIAEDSVSSFIFTEEAVRMLGAPISVGQLINWYPGLTINPNAKVAGRIIGVVKNMHFEPLYREIFPMIFRVRPNFGYLLVKINPDNGIRALAAMETVWEQIVPTRPFIYTYLNDDLNSIYQSEEYLSNVVGFGTILAIIIACLGLFGLASFTAEQRTKEIGIRKVIGATAPAIVVLMVKDFLKLILISIVIAMVASYFVINAWLEKFAYHTDFGWKTFVFSSLLALAIAVITVIYQAVKAALSDPVNALRYE